MQFQISSKRETGKEIPESSRLESLEKFSANNFALSDAEDYNSVDNTIGNLLKASRAKFLGSNGLFCFISMCKFHTCQLSWQNQETPGFNANLPVNQAKSWFLSQSNISMLFQNNNANQVYLYLLHTMKRIDFGQFFKVFLNFFLIHTFICMLFLKTKTFSPLCTVFQIRCTATHTWHAVKSLNIRLNIGKFVFFCVGGEGGGLREGDFGQSKKNSF